MVFDDTYSTEVNLSDILDCFIVDGESFRTIRTFLGKYSRSEITDIVSNSLYFNSIMHCREIEKMSIGDFIWFISEIMENDSIDDKTRKNTALQYTIFGNDFYKKNRLRKFAADNNMSYRVSSRKTITGFETLLCDGEYSKLNSMSDDTFKLMVDNSIESIFCHNMYQIGFLDSLDINKKIIFLMSGNRNLTRRYMLPGEMKKYMKTVYVLFSQVLSHEEDRGIKESVLNEIQLISSNPATYSISHIDGDFERIDDTYRNTESFEEFYMKMSLEGSISMIRKIVFFLICKGNNEYINRLVDFDRPTVERVIDISLFEK